MKDVLIFGIQWSGKWTQAKLLTEAFPWLFSYFASWDLFRAIIWAENAIGKYLKDRMERWDLISDRVTISLFYVYLQTVIDEGKNMLIDWFPRTIPQMEKMMKLLTKYKREIIGIQFVLSDEVAIERMKGRGRVDDTDEIIRHRIDQFYEKTQPTINRFAEHGTLVKINADRPIEEIAIDVKRVIWG